MGALNLELTGRSCALNSELFLKSKGGYQVQRSVRTDKGGQQHETRKPNILKHGCSVWWVGSYTKNDETVYEKMSQMSSTDMPAKI